MIQQISKYISSPPFAIQIAKDGNWEACWQIDLKVHIPREQEIDKFLLDSEFQSLAAELIFPDQFIWGMTFRKGLKVSSPKGFIVLLLQLALSFEDFEAFCHDVEDHILGFPGLFEGDPDLIRIGVVNHWFSLGPILIWEKGSNRELVMSELETKLNTKPEVATTKLNYQGLSFIYATQDARLPYHWIKSPCARQNENFWKVDPEKVATFMKEWLDFSIS